MREIAWFCKKLNLKVFFFVNLEIALISKIMQLCIVTWLQERLHLLKKKKGSRCISAFKRNKMLQLEIIKRSNITFKIIKLNDLVVGISFSFFLYISILHCFIDYLIICVLKKTMKIELSPSYLFKINNRNTRKR